MSNYKFKTTNIRGKQYVEVNERIKFFRQEEQYKDWSIITEVKEMTDTDVVMCTTIRDARGVPIATGHAHEVKGSSNINKTSHIENCETSAVGRALAMLGIGIDTSIASANEVETAIAQAEQPRDTKPSSPAKKAGNVKEEVSIMDKAVDYLKKSSDRSKAYDLVISKYGSELSEKQKAGLKKFVK
jgi:hypothetical protein|tara:strand:- start:12001 stop:12558 length:558 start_codon:yes stop_codon:yes gene_type:complete